MKSGNDDHPFGDTSTEALRVQYAALRKMTIQQRLAIMEGLSEMTRSIAREGIRRRNPGATEEEIDDLFADLVLGPELAAKVRAQRGKRPAS